MKKLRRIAATLTLATAAATGILFTGTAVAVPADTAWGAPATTEPAAPDHDTTPVTTFDTAWG